MEWENFKILEERVETLLKEYTELKQEKGRVEGELNDGKREFLELSGMIEKFEEERGLVKGKVESLLKRVEGLLKSISSLQSGVNL